MLWLRKCLYCGGFTYTLRDKRLKCSKCHKKTSILKINKIITLIYAFMDNESALRTSKRLSLSYVSVQKYYKEFRMFCAMICESEYEQKRDKHCEYEEYFYLEGAKKHKKEAVFDAYNFLTFDYENHIYTLLMPSLKQYKEQFLDASAEDVYFDEFKKFKRDNKIIKVSKHYNNIVLFWKYLEENIVHYKGIQNNYFAYYLKEYEFKYNHTNKEEAIELLLQHYFKD